MADFFRKYWPLLAAFGLGLALMFILKFKPVDSSEIKAAQARAEKAEREADSLRAVSRLHYRAYQADSSMASRKQAQSHKTAKTAATLRAQTHPIHGTQNTPPAPVSDSADASNARFLTEFLADKSAVK